ncbi:ECF-type sigma factor [Marinicella sp. W31]|uniref:ECF-type sigma factor n=1 Tax=Marinicella sp. W31 TaxID=3023713 RepID=UPI0037564799
MHEKTIATKIGEVTLILENLREGGDRAMEELVNIVYNDLHGNALRLLSRESSDMTLQATDLINETYLRLFDQESLLWQDRTHFISCAAIAMRRILIEHARKKKAKKRIPHEEKISLELSQQEPYTMAEEDILALDEALTLLGEIDPRQAQIVELRFFAGLTESEIAEMLNLSRNTISREWRTAKLWLKREMSR